MSDTTQNETSKPTSCPACGAAVKWNKETQVHFECGCALSFYPTQGWMYHVYLEAGWGCHRAYEAAVSLRRERDEAKRYSAHLEHENAALAVLHSNAVDERNAALARAEKAEGERDTYKTMYEFALQQHEQNETLFADYQSLNDLIGKERSEHSKKNAAITSELKRYKSVMPCGHARMLEILNDGQMPECAVCWLERVESELTAARARLAELQAVCDAARALIEYRDTVGVSITWPENSEKLIGALSDALDALAALASGAESEMTK